METARKTRTALSLQDGKEWERGIGMTVATLTSKGQITIPKQVREHLKLNPGDKLDFVIESEGRVVIRPAKLDVRELKGLLKRRDGKVLSIEEMNAAIARGAAGKR